MVMAGLVAGAKSALMRVAPFAGGFISGINTQKLVDNAIAGAGGYAYFHLLAKDKGKPGFTKKFSALRHLGPVALLAIADSYVDSPYLHSATQGVVGAMVYHWQWSKWVEEFKPATRRTVVSRTMTTPVARKNKTKLIMERPVLGGRVIRPPALRAWGGVKTPIGPIKLF